MVTLLTRNLSRKLRGVIAFATVIVRIPETRLTVGEKSARNLNYLVSVILTVTSRQGFENKDNLVSNELIGFKLRTVLRRFCNIFTVVNFQVLLSPTSWHQRFFRN